MHRVAGKAERGMINLAPLRNPVRLEDHCLHAAYFTVGLTRTIVDALVPHMRDQFQQWYGEQMKPALTYIQNVNING